MITTCQNTFRYLRRPSAGWALLACVAALTVLGMIMLTSAGSSFNSDSFYLFRKQFIWLALALIAGVVAAIG